MPTMDTALRIPNNPDRNGYGNNPRCLRRDVNNYFVENSLKGTDLASQITTSPTMTRFQDSLQNDTPQKSAIHSAGHFSIWGDPGGDVYVSPGEPVFWLHHGQVDRHWWMWANHLEAEVKTRTNAYEGESELLTWLPAANSISRWNQLDESQQCAWQAYRCAMARCRSTSGQEWHSQQPVVFDNSRTLLLSLPVDTRRLMGRLSFLASFMHQYHFFGAT